MIVHEIKITFLLLLAACLAISVVLGSQWEKKLVIPATGGVILRGQSSGGEDEPNFSRKTRTGKGISQKISRKGSELKAEYRFINFNKDPLTVSFSMPAQEYKSYLAGYGYSDKDLRELRVWHEGARQAAWKLAVPKGGKAAGEAALAAVDAEHAARRKELFCSRGMSLLPGGLVEADIPGIVRRNVAPLKPLAVSFQEISSDRGYSEAELVGAALSMVQTAVSHNVPPEMASGVRTCGLQPPVSVVLSGWGDCDSKTALLASILGNWNGIRMVGLSMPGHYLMGIRRLPRKGDVFIRYEGLEYVLMEPTGPAWLDIGTVSPRTAAMVSGAEGYRIEPFF